MNSRVLFVAAVVASGVAMRPVPGIAEPTRVAIAPALSPQSHLKYPGPAPDLGTPPPTSAAEYAPYRRRGTGSIEGQAVVQFTNGKYFPCGAGCFVQLVPDTPYTQWRIDMWAHLVDGREATDDDGWKTKRLPPLPSYLDLLQDASPIRSLGPDAYGDFRFTGIPAGRYLVVFHASDIIVSRGGTTEPELHQYQDGPDRTAIVETPGHPIGGSRLGEGYIVRSGSIVVHDGERKTIPVDALVTIAHLSG